MKQILVMMVAVVLAGQSLAADKKLLIADPIVEKEVRLRINKPTGELMEADVTGYIFFPDLPKLPELYLENTGLTDEGLKDVAKIKNIHTLALYGNRKITHKGLKEVVKLQDLETLYIGRFQLTDEGLNELVKMQQLRNLYLNESNITDEGLKKVAKLKNLLSLNLTHTIITDEGLKEVAKLQKLDRLYLRNKTHATDAGLKEVAKLQKLTLLDLSNKYTSGEQKFTLAAVTELKKALPNCKILWP